MIATPEVFLFNGLGCSPVPVRACPEPGESRPRTITYSAVAAVHELDTAILSVLQNTHLSAEGREARLEALEPMRAQTANRLKQLGIELDGVEKDLAAAVADFYRMPPYASGDVVSVLLDIERRTWFDGLTDAARTDLLRAIDKPENEAMRLALVRSPIGKSYDIEAVRQKIRDERDSNDREYSDGLKVRADAIEWARINLNLLSRVVLASMNELTKARADREGATA